MHSSARIAACCLLVTAPVLAGSYPPPPGPYVNPAVQEWLALQTEPLLETARAERAAASALELEPEPPGNVSDWSAGPELNADRKAEQPEASQGRHPPQAQAQSAGLVRRVDYRIEADGGRLVTGAEPQPVPPDLRREPPTSAALATAAGPTVSRTQPPPEQAPSAPLFRPMTEGLEVGDGYAHPTGQSPDSLVGDSSIPADNRALPWPAGEFETPASVPLRSTEELLAHYLGYDNEQTPDPGYAPVSARGAPRNAVPGRRYHYTPTATTYEFRPVEPTWSRWEPEPAPDYRAPNREQTLQDEVESYGYRTDRWR